MKIKINEIYYSIQGEIFVGRPTTFVRVSGCNLIQNNNECGFCDSKFAENGKKMELEDIITKIEEYSCKNVVITGGEPLYQRNIYKLVEVLQNKRYNVNLETNGSIFDKRMLLFDYIICSPKKQSINVKTLEFINKNINNKYFKFVYEKKEDEWWEGIIKKINIRSEDVYIMPEGKTREKQLSKMAEVVEYCKLKNYNFTPRLHILIWGNKRGV